MKREAKGGVASGTSEEVDGVKFANNLMHQEVFALMHWRRKELLEKTEDETMETSFIIRFPAMEIKAPLSVWISVGQMRATMVDDTDYEKPQARVRDFSLSRDGDDGLRAKLNHENYKSWGWGPFLRHPGNGLTNGLATWQPLISKEMLEVSKREFLY